MAKKLTPKQEIEQGGELPKAWLNKQDELLNQLDEMGLAIFTIDCSKARNLSALLRAFAKGVDYPVFFGKDLDAFYDCLVETVAEQKAGCVLWVQELHSADPSLKADVAEIFLILNEVVKNAQEHKKIFAFVVEHAGKLSAPEPGVEPQKYAEAAE
ncbi:hypothetical protein V757_09065 [Pelistega indica]|uniref:Barstar (barnase inhibitor) domain-containing protein n=1 Tax=Pelistega indica TaxID=1414851 RepID=V8G0Z8_9BURK|nr:barstar family protein [Pelistega indica]ETD69362.1 hypothetical protein V757_09065 [Pelistega indica]